MENRNNDLALVYEAYVQTVSANEARRQNASSLYVGLIAGGVAILGTIQTLDPLFIAIPILGLCVIWWFGVRYFRALSSAKFEVIRELEKTLPAKPFTEEWEIFKRTKRLGLTHLDMTVPIVIGFCSFAYIAFRCFTEISLSS